MPTRLNVKRPTRVAPSGAEGVSKADPRKLGRNGNGVKPIKDDWAEAAQQYADFALANLVVRDDVHGNYRRLRDRVKLGKATTVNGALTRAILRTHCRGEKPEHIIGAHTTSPANTVRVLVLDWDQHDDSPDPKAIAARNWAEAQRVYDHLTGLGFSVRLEDSDGNGGYHLWLLFEMPAPAASANAFGKGLVQKLGLHAEHFPKQASLRDGPGNWVRFPGRHHDGREHWSRFWDGSHWTEGREAIDLWLNLPLNDPALLPTPSAPAAPPRPPTADLARVRRLLAHLKPFRRDEYDSWVQVGMVIHSVDQTDAGLEVWREWSMESDRYEEGCCDKRWAGFHHDDGLGIGSLVEWAEENGYKERITASSVPDPSDHPPYPEPEPAMFHGPIGDFVRAVEPHTEADPVALLTQGLVAVGNVIGPYTYFQVEATAHPARLNALIVGQTSKGRKGVSLDRVKSLLAGADPDWAERNIASGLSSGEGLIAAVRDPVTRHDRKGQEIEEDPGEADKRLLVVEAEFASVLRVMKREGSTLSAIVRSAYDDGNLRSMTKNNPLRATGAHISIIGHITAEELTRELTETDRANGFANRFLIVCTRRSKLLPDGGEPYPEGLALISHRLRRIVQDRLQLGSLELKRDEEARDLWHAVYPTLSEGRPGLLGAITSRAEAQVTRLALLYAVLDEAVEIQRPHLEAALALWKYCEASAAFLFGAALGKPDAERILKALRDKPDGLTRTELTALFGNNDTRRVNEALMVLVKSGRASCRKEPTGGRPVELWFLS